MKFKVFRDWLQQMIYKIINPIVHGMIKIGITPNFITTTGLILNIVAACIFLYAGMKGERGDFYYIGWGGGIILFAGLFDMMDRTGCAYRQNEFHIRSLVRFGTGPLQRTDGFLRDMFLPDQSGICHQFDRRFHCFDRLINGKLCPRPCRRIGT